ncbi:MAG: 30S ribosomal protein S4 [Clostridiales bacterium]|jgi:small subunit ribosomal protein S4|nr:30S ribosomal protein S4 [Clostridiales bacterium]MDD6873761.1 30S ribosomal protein S4 [Clostridiales bacterium]MDD7368162.1 30S ribosomal protein S4 [Clostridiales bacterium]MDY2873323.1 30S ribosomal protein S4 [Eubacteriales bacterium]
MARYTGSVCRLCRREGTKLFLKGDRCYGPKCALANRQTIPGEHGQARQRKPSEYGLQLREKQKAKRAYGVMETQFHRYFETAERQKGITGENLLILLERRLDNVIYRMGFGASRPQARQIVRHGHVLVNGKKVNIPSYLVDANDVITIREKSAEQEHFKALREGTNRVIPKWLTVDNENLKATVTALPAREDVDLTLQEHLIVELYSR